MYSLLSNSVRIEYALRNSLGTPLILPAMPSKGEEEKAGLLRSSSLLLNSCFFYCSPVKD